MRVQRLALRVVSQERFERCVQLTSAADGPSGMRRMVEPKEGIVKDIFHEMGTN